MKAFDPKLAMDVGIVVSEGIPWLLRFRKIYHSTLLSFLGVFYDGPLGNMNAFWQKCGVKGVEMEVSGICLTSYPVLKAALIRSSMIVLQTMCSLRGVKSGSILNVDNYIFERLSENSEGYKPHRQVVKEVKRPLNSLRYSRILIVCD